MTHIPSASVLDQAHLPVAKTAMVLQGTSSVLFDMESTVMVSFCVVTKPRASDKSDHHAIDGLELWSLVSHVS